MTEIYKTESDVRVAYNFNEKNTYAYFCICLYTVLVVSLHTVLCIWSLVLFGEGDGQVLI